LLSWVTPLSGGLGGLVLAIAFLYSSVGFGGASGYLAVMAWFEIPLNVAVSTALTLNLIVAGIAFINYYSSGFFVPKLLWPFTVASIPAAFLGGTIKLGQFTYLVILHIILFVIAIRMLNSNNKQTDMIGVNPPLFWVTILVGAGLGLLSGMIGIGGGIFLSPIIIIANWGNSKHAATTAAGFILLNSLSGLIGRVLVGKFIFGSFGYVFIPIGVIGSIIGSAYGAKRFSNNTLKRLLGTILLLAVFRFVLSNV
jgi:uncharacterized membrane protein YfcA